MTDFLQTASKVLSNVVKIEEMMCANPECSRFAAQVLTQPSALENTLEALKGIFPEFFVNCS